jgi:sporulation protein YlmC with PRC-barrel domain
MTALAREVHVEQLLGRRVRDRDGRVVGRIEEFAAEETANGIALTEIHVGPAAMIERIARFVRELPLIGLLPFPYWEYRIPWRLVDLSDVRAPRLRCRHDELTRVAPRRSTATRAIRLG